MKIHELFEGPEQNLPNDGRGNVVVWDAQRRLEVLVPEKEVPTLVARRQLVGGALNMPTPSNYPEAPASSHNKKANAQPEPKPTSTFGHFKQGFKKGFTKTNKFTQDLEYTPVGQAVKGIHRFAQKHSKPSK